MAMNWTEKHIKGLLHGQKIRGYKAPERKKGYSQDRPQAIPREKSKAVVWLEWNLLYWANEHCLSLESEYQFDPERKWRSDWALTALKVLIEFEGGIFMQRGGHNSAAGIQRDIEKYTRAEQLGYTVIRLHAKNYTTVLKTLNDIIQCGKQ